jgi:ABC-2 type transport system permease protein
MKMNNRRLTKHLLIYEFLNAIGTIFPIIFGVAFPIFMAILFSNVIAGQVPESTQTDVRTSIFLMMIMIIPMAIMFIGYASTYSQEVENNISLRFDLFGISKRAVLISKILAYLIFLLLAVAIYFATVIPFVEIHTPSIGAVLLVIVVVVLLGALLVAIAH